MKWLNKADEAALRTIAERHGYTASSGPHAGAGSASRLIEAIIAGEVKTVLLPEDEIPHLVAWLLASAETAPVLLQDQIRSLARQLSTE